MRNPIFKFLKLIINILKYGKVKNFILSKFTSEKYREISQKMNL